MITGVWLVPEGEWGERDDLAVQFDEEQILVWCNGEHVHELGEVPAAWTRLVAEDPILRLIERWSSERPIGLGTKERIAELREALDTASRLSTPEEGDSHGGRQDEGQGHADRGAEGGRGAGH